MRTLVELIARYYLWVCLACGLGVLFYLRGAVVSRRKRGRALFTMERERAASRFWRSLLAIAVLLLLIGGVLGLGRSSLGQIAFPGRKAASPSPVVTPLFEPTPGPASPTPTPELTPTPTPLATSPTPTASPSATPSPQTASPSTTSTSTPAPACASGVCITFPGGGARLRGNIDILGTANIPDFNFYKLEVLPVNQPDKLSNISGERKAPVAEGILGSWDILAFPEGEYFLRLTVVNKTGNYPPPDEVRVIVEHPKATPSFAPTSTPTSTPTPTPAPTPTPTPKP